MRLLPFAFQRSADHLTDFRTANPSVYKTPSFLAKPSGSQSKPQQSTRKLGADDAPASNNGEGDSPDKIDHVH